MNDVEIYWPAALPQDSLHDAQQLLRELGMETTGRLEPSRHGDPGLTVLVLLTTSVLEPLLSAFARKLGTDAIPALQRLVRQLFGKPEASIKPATVVFESTTSGAQFIFTPDLSDEAFRKAVVLDPGEEPGRWIWDPNSREWIRFEARRPSETGERDDHA
jgi:hypothetical protein